MALSKTQVDRLGQRLKDGSHTEDDLRLLDEYRGTFTEAYEAVLQLLRRRGSSPTGRLKTTGSIAEKLRRESIRLSQVQDIAGCRVIVGGVVDQDRLVARLRTDFPSANVIDRRESPSHGYRAVHVIVAISKKMIEIQVRTSLQHLWAELSEKSSDVLDPAIKYGGGEKFWRDLLMNYSKMAAHAERAEKIDADPATGTGLGVRVKTRSALRRKLRKKRAEGKSGDPKTQKKLSDLNEDIEYRKRINKEFRKKSQAFRQGAAKLLAKAISALEQMKGQKK